MNWETVIIAVATGLATSLFTYYALRGNSKNVTLGNDGFYKLKLPKSYMYVGYSCLLIALASLLSLLFSSEDGLFVIVGFLVLLFGALSLPCLLGYYNHRVMFSDEKIVVSNWKKKETEIKWEEITEIKFNPFSGYINIKNENKKAKINHHMIGLRTFTDIMEKRTKWRSASLKLPKM